MSQIKKGKKIMIIDDDLSSLKSLSRALTLHGYSTDYFTDPHIALKSYRTTEHDIVVTDYMMPLMDGVTLIKSIRQIDPQARIILFSGFIDTDLLNKITELNIEAIYHKPLPLESFLSKLDSLLSLKETKSSSLLGIPMFI